MARPFKFDGANTVRTAPAGAENVSDLHVFSNGVCCASAWKLSPEELEEVKQSSVVFISVFSGKTQPPVYVGSESTTREVLADYGVWRKQ